MASQNDVSVVVALEDRASKGIKDVGHSIAGMSETSRRAVHELTYGMSLLGSSMLGLGVAMTQSDNQMTKNVGQTAMFVGGLLSAVGSSIQFIFAIGKMVKALKELAVAETIVQAFQGPKGWATLGISAAVAGGAVYGISKFSETQAKAEKAAVNQMTVIHNNVQGVITEQSLQEMNRSYVLKQGDRNGNSGANTRY
jgi:hypothetical protein